MTAPRKRLVGILLALLAAPGLRATQDVEMRRMLLKKGGEAFRAKEFMQAARLWHRACKLSPSAELWYRVGVALYKADDVDKARNALRKAVQLDPRHAKAAKALKRLEPSEPVPPEPGDGDGDGGEAAPPSLDRLEGVTVDPDEARAEQAWTDAHRLRKLGEYPKAVARFVDAYRFGYARAEVDFYLGQALLEDEVLDGALVHLRRAREEVPQDQGICLLLGKAYALQGDSSEQIDALETAVRLDPGYGEAHFQLALAMDLVGDSERVLEHSQKAIRIDPAYRDKLEDALRDGAVVGKVRDLLKASLNPDPGAPPPSEEDLDGYASRLTELLYPEAMPTRKDELAGPKRQSVVSSLGSAEPAQKASKTSVRDRSGQVAPGGGGAPMDEAFGDTEEEEDLRAPQESQLAPSAPAAPGPTLAGIQFHLVRRILQDLHEGKGRRAFERVPHGDRARFKRDFLAAIRDRPALADLRVRVEAALRER